MDENQKTAQSTDSQAEPTNEQLAPQITPMPVENTNELSAPKLSRSRFFFELLGVAQAVGVVLYLLIILWANLSLSSGASIDGISTIVFLMSLSLGPLMYLIVAINLIGLPIHILRQKPRGKALTLLAISLSISIALVLYKAYMTWQA